MSKAIFAAICAVSFFASANNAFADNVRQFRPVDEVAAMVFDDRVPVQSREPAITDNGEVVGTTIVFVEYGVRYEIIRDWSWDWCGRGPVPRMRIWVSTSGDPEEGDLMGDNGIDGIIDFAHPELGNPSTQYDRCSIATAPPYQPRNPENVGYWQNRYEAALSAALRVKRGENEGQIIP